MKIADAPYPSHETASADALNAAAAIDRSARAAIAPMTAGLSPVSLTLAFTEWALHLATAPGTQLRLCARAIGHSIEWTNQTLSSLHATANPGMAMSPVADSFGEDSRFAHDLWNAYPWNGLAAANKALESWWDDASNLPGMTLHSREQMRFYARQWLDVMSPSNWPATNPQVIHTAVHSAGDSLIKGAQHAVHEHLARHGVSAATDGPAPGAGLAMTPGRVVMRNELIELIQYAPTTDKVRPEPVLIIPSCIMKYYVLDLAPQRSLVEWLVGQGHTVFMISWRNPDKHDAALGIEDYIRSGVIAALNHVRDAIDHPVHLAGYCLGGTFAAIAAAVIQSGTVAIRGETEPLASLTLLAAETDFTEPGELGILVDEAQVTMLEAMMAETGYLSGRQMAGSFQFLHSRDLVWSNRTRSVLLGEPAFANDLMAWNADVTRLPAAMHSQYLRRLYLANDLAEGRLHYEGKPVSLRELRVPLFAVGTVKDHVSPWRSVYKIHRLVSGEVTFVLTNAGHNAGIVSPPGHPKRHFQAHTTAGGQAVLPPQKWAATAPAFDGSWWTAWHDWLCAHGKGRTVRARVPLSDDALGAAPGEYVMVRYAD